MSSLIEIGKKYPSSKNRFGFIQIYEKYFERIKRMLHDIVFKKDVTSLKKEMNIFDKYRKYT